MSEPFEFRTEQAVRLISGSLSQKRTKDRNNADIAEDKRKFDFGVALQKTHPDTTRLLTELLGAMGAMWATDQNKLTALNAYFQNGCKGLSLKMSDGDLPNAKGEFNENKRGCWIIYFTTPFAVPTFGPDLKPIAAEDIKRGYWVQIAGNIRDNGKPFGDGAGVYVNPVMVRLLYAGEEIRGGADASKVFAGSDISQFALPPGAIPITNAQIAAPQQAAGVPQAPVGVPGVPQAPVGVPGVPAMPQPHTAIINPPQQAAGVPGVLQDEIPF